MTGLVKSFIARVQIETGSPSQTSYLLKTACHFNTTLSPSLTHSLHFTSLTSFTLTLIWSLFLPWWTWRAALRPLRRRRRWCRGGSCAILRPQPPCAWAAPMQLGQRSFPLLETREWSATTTMPGTRGSSSHAGLLFHYLIMEKNQSCCLLWLRERRPWTTTTTIFITRSRKCHCRKHHHQFYLLRIMFSR